MHRDSVEAGKMNVCLFSCNAHFQLLIVAHHFLSIITLQSIFRMTNGMYPELITRPDVKIFLPPIGGLTIYIWGDPDTIPDEDIELTCRVHDECNGSDVSSSVFLIHHSSSLC